jgi:hypothetical protein
VTSTYQIEFPPDFVRKFAPRSAEHANLLIPLTTRPKKTLLNFDIRVGEDKEGFLLPRTAIAEIEAVALLSVRDSSPAPRRCLQGLNFRLLYAICSFTPATWDTFLAEHGGDRQSAVAAYLEDGLGFVVSPARLAGWLRIAAASRRVLVDALEEPPDDRSSSEHVLLALPGLDPPPRHPFEVTSILVGFRRAIQCALTAEDDTLLSDLAEYGRRWEVLIEAEVPLHRPTLIRIAEDRPLGLSAGRTIQRVALGDAASVHFEARVADQHVVLDVQDFGVTDLEGNPVGVPYIESVLVTPESLSLYTSVGRDERPDYVNVHLRLAQAPSVRWVVPSAWGLTLTAALGLLIVSGDSLAERLSVLLFPATIAVTWLLTREETPLGAALSVRRRSTLVFAVGLLWVIALYRLVADESHLPQIWRGLQDLWSGLQEIWSNYVPPNVRRWVSMTNTLWL